MFSRTAAIDSVTMSSSSLPSLTPPLGSSGRRSSSNGSSSTTTTSSSLHRNSSLGSASLPPPPNVTPQKQSTAVPAPQRSSMTIDEMRTLHRKAVQDAEAKQTELRLVLASRYRELVGSSDEVIKMKERAIELHNLVSHVPQLMEKLIVTANGKDDNDAEDEEEKEEKKTNDTEISLEEIKILKLRQQLSNLPRLIHRALDKNDVFEATESLMQLFQLIAEQTDEYPLATALSSSSPTTGVMTKQNKVQQPMDTMLVTAQMRMTYLHVQTLPAKIIRIAKQILNSATSFDVNNGHVKDPKYGAERSAAALSALDLLEVRPNYQQHGGGGGDRSVELLDLYFDSKAKLLQLLLSQLNTSPTQATPNKEEQGLDSTAGNAEQKSSITTNAEEILSKIVLILQYDIIMHPYQIFVLRKFPSVDTNGQQIKNEPKDSIMKSLPMFPAAIVQAKASNFLSAHLPLIRTKVKGVLVDIAGTTASALGKIRQSLYDKTDGVECMERLDRNDICTWDEAVSGVVDVKSVLNSSQVGVGSGPMAFVESTSIAGSTGRDRKFSLWGVLFSSTFTSLVHSLLTTSFQSVHTKVVSTLRMSLTNAPPLGSILPHEAYRNTLHIASELDAALLKVSDDAHELLVHAEEREESERRLRQSLYVQTCEIMGRLICELRRMLLISDNFDAVKQLIVGRLCHLLKYRLTALPTLLDPNSLPAVLNGTTGMISLMELSSAFDLADDNDDGLITFQEAMEAVDSAFSGTQFHGAEMVRETLLLPATSDKDRSLQTSNALDSKAVTPHDVTLDELTLLLARGLRHENSGEHSALGTIQHSLDSMITACFDKWATEALEPCSFSLSTHVKNFVTVACNSSEEEYQRMYSSAESVSAGASPVVDNVSPYITSFLVDISFTLNRSVCPSDSLLPVPSIEVAAAMGMNDTDIPRMIDMIRWALLKQGLQAAVNAVKENIGPALERNANPAMKDSGPSGIAQLKNDLLLIQECFFERNRHAFGKRGVEDTAKADLHKLSKTVDILVRRVCDMNTLQQIEAKHKYLLEVCDLFFSSLFGEDSSAAVPLGDIGGGVGATPRSGTTPLYHPPLSSSYRFPLLPIQADRTLSGVQARGKYKEKEEADSRSDNVGGGAVRASFGFFSQMLKKS